MNWLLRFKSKENKKRDINSSSSFSKNLFDLENAAPAPNELEAYESLQTSLIIPMEKARKIIKLYYKPATDDIRKSINAPANKRYEQKAEMAVMPAVFIMHTLYKLSTEIDVGVATLLLELFKNEPDPISISDLNKNPGLTRLFAVILGFAYDFDSFKLDHPSLQNDFSYYKRMLQRGKMVVKDSNEETSEGDIFPLSTSEMLDGEVVHKISMVIAYPMPMTRCVIGAVLRCSKLQHRKGNSIHLVSARSSLGEWLQSIWRASYVALNTKKSRQKKAAKDKKNITVDDEQAQLSEWTSIEYLLKVMIQSIILYDCVNPGWAFQRNTPIFIKESLDLLLYFYLQQKKRQNEPGSLSNLITVLYYNAKHLTEESTPKSIRNMIYLFQEKKKKK